VVYLGFKLGSEEKVEVPTQHTIVSAQTRYGKSTTLKRMMMGLTDDFKVLCLDVKDPRDFEGVGVEVPIYIEDRTDPLMLKQLLEQESHLWLRREFPELIDLCKEGDTYEKVYERVCLRMEEKLHPIVKDRVKVLKLLLEKLVANMEKVPLTDKLELPHKINVMNLSKVPSEIKQLAVHSSIKEILINHQNVIIIIDELPDFAPQGYRTPSKSMITQAIRKGGAKNIWLWLSGQTMTGVDKQVLKQAMIWILGHQREINEAKRTLDQIPFKTGLTVEDIMTLPVGSFVVCTDQGAYMTYIQHPLIDEDTAKLVSLGQITSEEAISKLRLTEDEDMYREMYEEEKHKREELEKNITELINRIHELEVKKKLMDQKDEEIKELKDQLKKLQGLQTALSQVIPIEKILPSGKINLEHRELEVEISHTEETVEMSTKTGLGKILYVAIETLPKDGFTEKELSDALDERGWHTPHSTLAPNLAQLCKQGYLIKITNQKPTKYKLPTLLKIKIEKEE
jgi:polyhydroxyalkanoate synthesis regulator phasin